MFSYFGTGITDTKCQKIIGLPELRQLIRNNPHAGKIAELRCLRKDGDEYYKVLKSSLPNITPNCIVSERNLDQEHFNSSLRQFSQYIYFDFDGQNNPEDYKRYFIERYGHLASMVCISSGYGGISALFKVSQPVTTDNYDNIWYWIRNSILSDETVDPQCRGIGRAMFISHDPDVYCNFDNEIDIPIVELIEPNHFKWESQSKSRGNTYYSLTYSSGPIPIQNVFQKLQTKTRVDVINPVVDFKPVEYLAVYPPKKIKDGTKHRIYTAMIHSLVYLNPNIEEEYIYSYLYFVNKNHADPQMESREFTRLFKMVYNEIKKSGRTDVRKEIRYIHFNPECSISKQDKVTISNLLNGVKRKNESILKIMETKQILEQKGIHITQKQIIKLSGLSSKTVRTYMNKNLTDIAEIVEMINQSY